MVSWHSFSAGGSSSSSQASQPRQRFATGDCDFGGGSVGRRHRRDASVNDRVLVRLGGRSQVVHLDGGSDGGRGTASATVLESVSHG